MLAWRLKRAFSTSNAPNVSSMELNRTLQMGGKAKDLKCVRRTHQKIIMHQLGFDSFLMTKLVQSYADCDHFLYAQKLFDKLPRPNVFAWTAMLALCNRRGLPRECLQMYGRMRVEGVVPDKYVFPKVLRSCAQLLWLELGMVLHKDAICCGGEFNLQVCNALIDMYSKCGDFGRARKLFDQMGVRDLLTWNSLLSGYVSNGFHEKVVELFDAMKLEGVQPDLISWNTVIDAYCRMERCDQALGLFENISEPNIISWTTIISGYSRIGKPEMALSLFSNMVQSGVTPDLDSLSTALASCRAVNVLTTGREIHAFGMKVNAIPPFYKSCGAALLAMYGASKRLQDAVNVYRLMDELDVVTWNAMIHGYVDLGSEQMALTCFGKMQNLGIECDETTLATVLPACDLKCGAQIHAYVCRRSFSMTVAVWNALIHMYSKCGCVGSAYSLFNGLSVKDTISWNTIINGFGMHGHGHTAIQLLKEMNQSGLRPNSVTFTSVLSACSHSGLVDEGLELFHSLTKDFSFVPQREHYACIVDLLARCGRLEEAVNFVQTMPFEPDKCIWGSMLAASSGYQNAHVATLAAEHLFVLEPKHAGHYVTLSNILVRDGKWEEAAQVRRRMEDRGLVKPSGYSWVNAEN
uniref:Pentatricopeptide repeat-containing protein n=1 Tax=Kalanchoe fedtschenkoi TaxID=63787 RepID=A0A7N0T9F8_KALFE